MKKIVFVAGTSHSGSTLLDLMISTNPDAYSLGEVVSLFRPRESHHFDPICGCGTKNCLKWVNVRRYGEKQLYQTIFGQNPEVDILVDSSKDPLWIKDQLTYLHGSDYQIFHFLIWKTPIEIANSLHKRNLLHTWKALWIKYHLRYLSVVPNPVSIRYSELVRNPERVLRAIFEKMGCDYVKGQEEYWRKKHHNLFGSASARIHLHEPGSPEYARLASYIAAHQRGNAERDNVSIKHYRKLYYKRPDKCNLPPLVLQQIEHNPLVVELKATLDSFDLNRSMSQKSEQLKKIPKPDLLWPIKLRAKGRLRCLKTRLKLMLSKQI